MQVSFWDLSRRFKAFVLLGAASVGVLLGEPLAQEQKSPLHWSGNRTVWDRKTNRVELFGNAVVRQPGETLSADYMILDLNARTVEAKGNSLYISGDTAMRGDEMFVNMDTRTGMVLNGKVTSDRFTLSGERINKLSDVRFQTSKGTYSTCKDCPQSWSFEAEEVDLTMGGYATMTNVSGKIKEAPFFWTPYLIVPVKTERQTGFLFPKFSLTNEGFNYLVPFFWAASRSTDMTLGVGEYAGRGLRAELEGRYNFGNGSEATANAYFVRDSEFQKLVDSRNVENNANYKVDPERWGLNIKQTQRLPFSLEQRFRLLEASDNLFPGDFQTIPGYGEAVLTSDLIIARPSSQLSGYVHAQRHRNLLTPDPSRFDSQTVQVVPKAALTLNSYAPFNGPIATGFSLGVTKFARGAEFYDRDQLTDPRLVTGSFRPGQDPIREGTRVSYTPNLYTTFRPFGVLSVIPSAEYRGFFYSFGNGVPDLTRGYLLLRTDISTQFERIYDTSYIDIPRVKHLIRPIITYNLIPHVDENYRGKSAGKPHPFLQQIEYARSKGATGYQFDNYDIVPIDASRDYAQYFLPLGHSVSYGMTTQLIRRRGRVELDRVNYQRSVELRGGQSFNFREAKRATDQQPFSKAFASLIFEFDKWGSTTDYEYYPYQPIDERNSRHAVSTNFSYIAEKGVRNGVMTFERSFNLGYTMRRAGGETSNLRGSFNYSINDYLMPSAFSDYDFIRPEWLGAGAGLRFQSPSECWKLDLGAKRLKCDKPNGFCFTFNVDLAINLTGSGFSGLGEAASTAVSPPGQ